MLQYLYGFNITFHVTEAGKQMDKLPASSVVFAEYWDVSVANEPAWRDYFENIIVPANSRCEGYLGCKLMRRSPWWRDPDGGPRKALQPHFGLRLGGVRTRTSINFSALLQHEYTYLAVHEFAGAIPADFLDRWMDAWEDLRPTWRVDHPGVDEAEEALSREFFALVDNHWDVTYDVVATLNA